MKEDVVKMQGTPAHIECLKRKENDERRHISRCVFYDSESKHCSYYNELCRKSSHCGAYSEDIRIIYPEFKELNQEQIFFLNNYVDREDLPNFFDAKWIKISDCIIHKCNEGKESEYNKIDRPFPVDEKNTNYYFTNYIYEQFCLMVKKEISIIPITIRKTDKSNTKKNPNIARRNKDIELLKTDGSVVYVEGDSGFCKVISHTTNSVKIRLSTGQEKIFDIKSALDTGKVKPY